MMSDEALAAVWRLDPNRLSVSRIELETEPMRSFSAAGWTVQISDKLLSLVSHQRAARLPSETGGVLLGDFDVQRRRIYLAALLESPADSIESPGTFVRGAFGLRQELLAVERRTLGMLQYVGEWHSHPDGVAALPSVDDLALYGHLSEEMEVEGFPPVMLIAGAGHFGILVDGKLVLDINDGAG